LLERRLLLSADIFVTNLAAGTIGEYTNSGQTLNATLVSGLNAPKGIAVSGGDLFVANSGSGTIGEYTTNGATVNASLITGLTDPESIVVSGNTLYVLTGTTGSTYTRLGSYDATTGAAINPTLLSGLYDPVDMTFDGSDFFISEGNEFGSPAAAIAEYDLTGAPVNTSLVAGTFLGLAVSNTNLFAITNSNSVGLYTTAGAATNPSFISPLNAPTTIAINGGDLFVVNSGGSIGEFNSVTGAAVNAALVSGLDNPYGIAVETVGAAARVAFEQQPSDVLTGNNNFPPVTVAVEDANGNLITTDNSNVTVSINTGPTGAQLDGTTTVQAVNGIATFSNLSLLDPGTYTLKASDAALTFATSTAFTVANADIFVTNLAAGTISEYTNLGQTLNATLVSGLNAPKGIAVSGDDLFVANSGSGTVGEYTTSGATVDASLIKGLTDPESIIVSGDTLYVLSGGAGADFKRLGSYDAATGEALDPTLITGLYDPVDVSFDGTDFFISGGNAFGSTAVAIGEYNLAGQPVNASLVTGTFLGLAVADIDNNTDLFAVTHNDSIGLYTTAGATINPSFISPLISPTTIAIDTGDLFVVNSGGSIGEYNSVTGAAVNAALISGLKNNPYGIAIEDVGDADQLAFVQQPSNVLAGSAISPPVTVAVEDENGNLVTNDNSNVTMSINTGGPTGAELGGNATVQAVNGIATFSNLSLVNPGPYTLAATDSDIDLASATSTPFTVTTPPPVVTANPTSLTVAARQTVTFTAAATGLNTPTVQWQVSVNGGSTFRNVPGATSTTYSFTASQSQNGEQFRALFTNSGGSTPTTAASLTVNTNLVPTLVNVVLPATAIAGAKLKARLPVLVTNLGNNFGGFLTYNVYADTGTTLDGNQILVGSFKKYAFIRQGKSHLVTGVRLKSLPATLPAGTYHLIVAMRDPIGLTRVTATTQTVTVTA
jgi:hypothetical protein